MTFVPRGGRGLDAAERERRLPALRRRHDEAIAGLRASRHRLRRDLRDLAVVRPADDRVRRRSRRRLRRRRREAEQPREDANGF